MLSGSGEYFMFPEETSLETVEWSNFDYFVYVFDVYSFTHV